ncbi:MAG: iron-sulfur cluster repair di-iron protein [Cyclobacteriaceae bacterium]
MRVFERTISDIVDENYIYARALSYLGIEFYVYPNKKLGELCEEMGLVKEQVMRSFYLFDQNHRLSLRELNNYPLEIVIQYLKHTHNTFIKDKLPYIARLINNVEGKEDVKLIFPEFVEEFIYHIYDEEDTVFTYIDKLIKLDKGKVSNPAVALMNLGDYSLEAIHREHEGDDEMRGIRMLVDNVQDDDLHWRVIAREIRSFDREMMYHAQIENKIMFPKAIALEKSLGDKINKLSRLN